MNCEHIEEYKGVPVCKVTGCGNPQPEFCLLACPLKFKHKADDSLEVFLEKKAETQIETKAITLKKTNRELATDSCSNEIYVLLAHYFRQLCMACENNLHCDAKNFSKCLLKSSKWNTCPRGFWTEEMWNEALEKTKETK